MDKQLQKLIELSRKTGDRLIVFDPSNERSAYVVMPIDDYEKIALGRSEVRGLTEDELLDKINRDIAIWKSDRVDDVEDLKMSTNRTKVESKDDDFDSEEDDWYSIEEIASKSDFNRPEYDLDRKGRAWKIPSERKEKAEEIIDEDRYYLENLED
jgi:hypothetical protein